MPRASGAKPKSKKPVSLPSGTVSFLFTDIEGSTRRWETHRAQMQHAVKRHDELIRAISTKHGGVVFKTIGDAFCIAFGRPEDALGAALDAQNILGGEDFTGVDGLRARMAIHTGTADERDGDYFGPTVNRVARLLAVGHGGQVLVSGTAADLLQGSMPARTSLRDLGEHLLRDLARPEQVYQVVSPGLPEIFPALRSLGALPNNLPRQATTFIGRDEELTEIKALLAKSQLVTLVGTGGVGKTRTALQVGADLLDGSGDGVWFVDLAQVAAPAYVVPEVARVFSIQPQADRDFLDDLRFYLKSKNLLLIVDNCEHVVAEASRVIADLIKACPRVWVLATSREGLNVHGEQVYRMPSLSVPPPTEKIDAEEALRYGAVALFVARASALDSQFTFGDDKVPIVLDICRRLDGIALAIELAAARVTILSLKQLSQRLDERFRLLTGGDRTALPRQQTMRAAIDWSYELLSDTEQTLFRRLSIFQGGWTLEAASAVCSDDSLDEFAIFDTLALLVNKSLVVVELGAETQRYRLLESLRQYGVERLKQRSELDGAARRHARYFADYGRRVADKWQTMPDVAWLASIDAELDNIRAALDWALAQGNDPMLGAALAEGLWVFWFGRSHHEGKQWTEAARAAVDPQSDPALSVDIDLALTRMRVGKSREETLALCERALDGARALGDERRLARAVFYWGEALVFENRNEEAVAALTEALEHAKSVGDRYRATSAIQLLAKAYVRLGRLAEARERFGTAMQYYATRSVERNHGIALIDMALLERLSGDAQRAMALTLEARKIAQTLRDRNLEIIAEAAGGWHCLLSGQFDAARATAHRYLTISIEERFEFGVVSAVQTLGGVAVHREDFERAARLLGYSEANAARFFGQNPWVDFDIESLLRPLRDRLGEETLAALMAEGAAWAEDRVVEEALKV
jgi:predicted ATPase/class 3 adenylate cyclase/Flp pilus assembly protein TadD